MRDVFIEDLFKIAKKDKDIFLIVADLGFSVIEKFQNTYPDRFLNVGVAEQNMIGIASGLASEGYKVFVYSIGNFSTFRCAEQIRNDIDYHKLPVTIVSVGAGYYYGNLGYTHHTLQDLSLMRSFPNMNIFCPGSSDEMKFSLNKIANNRTPNYLRIGRETIFLSKELKINKDLFFEYKKSNYKKIILTTGSIIGRVLKNKKKFIFNKNVTSLPNWGTIHKQKIFMYLKKFETIYTFEDHFLDGGFGSFIREIFNNKKENPVIKNFHINNSELSLAADENSLLNNNDL